MVDYDTAAIVARRVVEKVIGDGLAPGVILNINVPYLKESDLKGYMITRQGLRVYRDRPTSAWIRGDGPITGLAARDTPTSTKPAPMWGPWRKDTCRSRRSSWTLPTTRPSRR